MCIDTRGDAPRRGAQRLGVAVLEAGAGGRQPVEVRRVVGRAAVGADALVTVTTAIAVVPVRSARMRFAVPLIEAPLIIFCCRGLRAAARKSAAACWRAFAKPARSRKLIAIGNQTAYTGQVIEITR